MRIAERPGVDVAAFGALLAQAAGREPGGQLSSNAPVSGAARRPAARIGETPMRRLHCRLSCGKVCRDRSGKRWRRTAKLAALAFAASLDMILISRIVYVA